MKKLLAASLLVFTLIQSSIAEDVLYPAPVAKLDLKDGDSIVFLGDSITHQCLYTQYVEDYFYTRFPKMRLKFHNAGVGGAKAWDALERFDRDVAAYKPKYVTVLLGMNDGTYRPYDEETFRKYHTDMKTLIGRLTEIKATPILMTPTMYDSRAARLWPRKNRPNPPERLELYNSVLAYYGTWLREVAVERGFGFVDMYSRLNNITLQSRKSDPNFTIIRDAVHPDAPGQVVMAFSILEDMAMPRQVSNIRIRKGGGGKPTAIVSGGKVTDLKYTEDGVSFTFAANSLPWVVPQEAALGAKLTKLGHRMSREALEVHGLKPDRYELCIDGDVVGAFHSTALSRHIELQQNEKTPQYQQSMQVATLNKERNDGPVKNLRNEWRVFQAWSRLNANAKTEADKAKVAGFAKRLEGMKERIAKHETDAKAIEGKIFEVNQPQPRKYVLKRVK